MSAERKRRRVLLLCRALGVAALAAGGGYGLFCLERSVLSAPQFSGPARIRLVNAPEDLQEQLMAPLGRFAHVPWSSPALPSQIGEALRKEPWVKQVVQVRRYPDRTIEVHCTYRHPLAMIQVDSGFYLVDEDRVRLPGRYAYHPSVKLIQGVRGEPPLAGQVWTAPDLRAGLDLVRLLAAEPFSAQITAVLVHNYGGRIDKRGAQLELATDTAGGRIIWGSALGQEMEENTAAQKIAILRSNYERFGHVGAGRDVIDISILPDRVHAPA
jgi:hypothetical protein